jgi:hypothetical protein
LDGPLHVFASIENQGYIAALYYGKMNNDIFLETANMIEPSMYMTGHWIAPYKVLFMWM